MTRPEETNQRSETEFKETEHGGDLLQNTRGDESSYVIGSTVGQSFGEAQEFLRTTTQANRDFEVSALLVMALL